MPDDPDPPRKFYGFKDREFERANEVGPPPPPASPPRADPGIVPTSQGKIDVNELIRLGAGKGAQLGSNAVRNRSNEVHEVLREKYERDRAAGEFDLGPLDDSKRRKRIRNYWIAVTVADVPLALLAWRVGHQSALFFVLSIAAIAMITSILTWKTFFLRTHY